VSAVRGAAAGPVVVEDDGSVRIVTLHRPEARNAFNVAMYQAVTEALVAARDEERVRVVVLTGSGSAFSAGQDLKEMAALVAGDGPPGAGQGFRGLMDELGGFDKPLLAAVNGVGVGLGFTILAHCDIVLVSDEARLRVPFAELGVPAEAGASYLFPMRMGAQRAAEVLFTGKWVTAEEAVASGIALRTVAPEALMAETMALAGAIAKGSPATHKRTRRNVSR
jgi:enoyl-CoA hydratase/carnithine racemase